MAGGLSIKVDINLRKLPAAKLPKAQLLINDAVEATALEIVSDVKRAIARGPKTGRLYARRGVVHQASAKGEAPATDRGTLVNSIYHIRPTATSAVVGSRLAYAYYLEFGTTTMDYRPSWFPAKEKAQPKFKKRVERAIKRGMA